MQGIGNLRLAAISFDWHHHPKKLLLPVHTSTGTFSFQIQNCSKQDRIYIHFKYW